MLPDCCLRSVFSDDFWCVEPRRQRAFSLWVSSRGTPSALRRAGRPLTPAFLAKVQPRPRRGLWAVGKP